MKTPELSSSIEDYLEAIAGLEKTRRVARVKDIAELLNVQMPSVTGALKILKGKGLVNHEKNSYITLTEKGMKVADAVRLKHKSLVRFLSEMLLLPRAEAQDEACKMEHAMSIETVDRLQRMMDYFKEIHAGSGRVRARNWKSVILGEKGDVKRRDVTASTRSASV